MALLLIISELHFQRKFVEQRLYNSQKQTMAKRWISSKYFLNLLKNTHSQDLSFRGQWTDSMNMPATLYKQALTLGPMLREASAQVHQEAQCRAGLDHGQYAKAQGRSTCCRCVPVSLHRLLKPNTTKVVCANWPNVKSAKRRKKTNGISNVIELRYHEW